MPVLTAGKTEKQATTIGTTSLLKRFGLGKYVLVLKDKQ
jgi:hypothetical protein